jgi:hypothetical protein
VVQDHQGVGERAGQRRGFTEVPPRRLEVERKPVARETREPGAPPRVPHRSGSAGNDGVRRWRRDRLVTDAADERASGLAREHVLHVTSVEPRLGDHGGGEAFPGGEALHPARLPEGVRRVPLRLHVDRAHDPVTAGVDSVVRRQVGAPERPRIPVAEGQGRLRAEPRVLVEGDVPEVLVGVDDGQVVRTRHRPPVASH